MHEDVHIIWHRRLQVIERQNPFQPNSFTANDNATTREQFLAILEAGYDPVILFSGLHGVVDRERRFLARLHNFYRMLRTTGRVAR
jgi:hypothetical protein